MRHLARLRRLTAVLGFLPWGYSCTATGPEESLLPLGAVALTPPAAYGEWYLRTQACSGLAGNLATVEFYVVPGVDTFPTDQGPKVGLWTRAGRLNRIVLAGNYAQHEMVVRHEMLHELLGREGHPTEYFVDRCHLTWDSWESAGDE